ncbi:MAG TPA: hypothetical protein VK507_19125 [Iamia sp.]|nr:hypothetical protein [Iamia sp.]
MGDAPVCQWPLFAYEVTRLPVQVPCHLPVTYEATLAQDDGGPWKFVLCHTHAGRAQVDGFTLWLNSRSGGVGWSAAGGYVVKLADGDWEPAHTDQTVRDHEFLVEMRRQMDTPGPPPFPGITVGRLAYSGCEPTADDVERFQDAERRVVDGMDAARFDAWARGLCDLTDEQLEGWAQRSDLQPDQRVEVDAEHRRRVLAAARIAAHYRPTRTGPVVVCPSCDVVAFPDCLRCRGEGVIPAPDGFVPRDFQAPERGVVAPVVAAAVLAAPLVLAAGWEAWESYRAWRTGRRALRLLRDLGVVD